jgi:AhpD family alkylhydroperoxidase
MGERLKAFREFRETMNARIHESGNLEIKRFFALDSRAYEAGALPVKTKELLGLVASLVLRCDDCITYHIVRCREEGVTREEFFETFNVALVVGGSITIPHLRRAVAALDEVEALAAHETGVGSPSPGGSQPGYGGVSPERPSAAEAESRESEGA